jgi:hypothetical protein
MAKDYSTDSRDGTRRAAIEILSEGLATHSEVARLAGVSRQLVRHWADREGIDVPRTRAAKLREMWQHKLKRR